MADEQTKKFVEVMVPILEQESNMTWGPKGVGRIVRWTCELSKSRIVDAAPSQSANWAKVAELLGTLYERYGTGKVGPAHSGYDTALDELMRAYGEWLD